MNQEKTVFQNIEESPYYISINSFKFYFSSAFYLKIFNNKYKSYVREESLKLKNRYKIFNKNFEKMLEEVLLLSLYKKIEKRGFKVFKFNERYVENVL